VIDIAPPGRWVLSAISDSRVRQYWDPQHLVSSRLEADARPPQPEPDCCDHSGVLWDLVAVYPKGAIWQERMPTATVFNGTVIDLPDVLESALAPGK